MRQFGVGMAICRSDNDGVGYRYTLPRGIRFPWNWYDGLSEYLKSGSTVWCPLPDDWEGSRIGHGLYHMQVLLDPPGSPQYTSYSVVSEPGRVIVSCGNHARGDYTSSVAERHAGPYIFLREDLSVGKMDSSKIKPYYYNSDWSKFIEQISPGTSYRVYWRFGDEPWPVHKDG